MNFLLSVGGRKISNEDAAPLSSETILLHVTNLATFPADLGAPRSGLLEIRFSVKKKNISGMRPTYLLTAGGGGGGTLIDGGCF